MQNNDNISYPDFEENAQNVQRYQQPLLNNNIPQNPQYMQQYQNGYPNQYQYNHQNTYPQPQNPYQMNQQYYPQNTYGDQRLIQNNMPQQGFQNNPNNIRMSHQRRTEIKIYQKNMMPRHSVYTECFKCKHVGYTRIEQETINSQLGCIIFTILLMIIFLPLFPIFLIILCCVLSTSKKEYQIMHYCNGCQKYIGRAAGTFEY